MDAAQSASSMPQSLVDGVLLRFGSPFWVGFGPVEADSLWAESFEVIEDRLKEGEFGWMLREWRGWALDYVRDGFAVRVDNISLLGRKLPPTYG